MEVQETSPQIQLNAIEIIADVFLVTCQCTPEAVIIVVKMRANSNPISSCKNRCDKKSKNPTVQLNCLAQFLRKGLARANLKVHVNIAPATGKADAISAKLD